MAGIHIAFLDDFRWRGIRQFSLRVTPYFDRSKHSIRKNPPPHSALPHEMSARAGQEGGRAEKFLTNLVCAVVLLPGGQLAEAGTVAANLKVSARVVRSCGISPSPLAFRHSHSQATDEYSEIGAVNGLKINCNTASGGTMALSVGVNMAGNAVIRVISNDKLGAETLKEAYLTHGGMNSPATTINLGLFPTAGTKVILSQSDNRAGSQLPIGTHERTMTLFIDF